MSQSWIGSLRFYRLRPSGPPSATQRRTIGVVVLGLIASAPCAPRPTLAWLRSEPSSLRDDGLTRSPAERGLEGLRPRRWRAGGLLLSRNTLNPAVDPREPGSAIVWSAVRSRMAVPTQWRTRHPAAQFLAPLIRGR